EGNGVRPPVPCTDDPAPQRRAQDGVRSLRDAARGSGRGRVGLRERRPIRADRRDWNDAANAFESLKPPSTSTAPLPELYPMGTARRISAFAALVAIASLPALQAQTYPTGNDPRNGLKPGMYDAGTAAQGMKLVSFSPKPAEFDSVKGLTFINSDIAFRDHYVYQGNFAGFMIWDVKNPAKPVKVAVVPCITSQGDPSIVGHLLFISAEGNGNRNDCAKGGVKDPKDHMAGVRIYDVSNPANPRLVKNVQTCKGSHTHTIIPSRKDRNVIYIYVSGSQGARPETEVPGCTNGTDPADETNSLFRLDVIKVELDHPEKA